MSIRSLSEGQICSLVGLGGLYWFSGAIMVRYGTPVICSDKLQQLAAYSAALPILYTMVRVGETAVGFNANQGITSAAVMGATALLLDGAAFTWFPEIYENPELKKKNPELAKTFSRAGAGWIFWGAGIGLACALFRYK